MLWIEGKTQGHWTLNEGNLFAKLITCDLFRLHDPWAVSLIDNIELNTVDADPTTLGRE